MEYKIIMDAIVAIMNIALANQHGQALGTTTGPFLC